MLAEWGLSAATIEIFRVWTDDGLRKCVPVIVKSAENCQRYHTDIRPRYHTDIPILNAALSCYRNKQTDEHERSANASLIRNFQGTMASFNELVVLAASVFVAYVVYKFIKLSNFFNDLGMPYVKPIWPFGSEVRGLFMRDHITTSLANIYYKLEPHKMGGFYNAMRPAIMIRDPELVDRVYTTDFGHFVDRGAITDPKRHPLEGHLFLLKGAKWRFMRAKLSPIFTSGKLKFMYQEMRKCADSFIAHLEKTVPFGKDIDMKEDSVGFTIQVISSCAFGIESNSIGNPNSELVLYSKRIFSLSTLTIVKIVTRMIAPWLFDLLRLKQMPKEDEDFIINIVKQTLNHRLTTGYSRNDFMQLLLQLREKGSVEVEEHEKDEDDHQETKHQMNHSIGKEVIEMDDGVLGAQAFVFLIAGFETTSSTIYHLTYLLSQNQDCQEKAREEVNRLLAKHGDYTYEMLRELTYLNYCIDETLRLFPPVPANFRVCTRECTFPDGTTIPKGTAVFIPVYSIHRDPKYFPEPEKFKPERFEQGITKGAYSPFGDGPRICIGKRFAQVEIKLAMAMLLKTFRFCPGSTEKGKITFKPRSFLLSVEGGLPMKMEKI
ncbi:hypothetical protein GE061_003586 [Apolygus lucorum]|uniref:Cytochrome P450 n=1 Tax=Apolygus lucorum TaxID=248454 RepID=A0A8S9X3Y5_APOLU|nr:hypothetical protein GE061_003586 [Apolygus lucorum]